MHTDLPFTDFNYKYAKEFFALYKNTDRFTKDVLISDVCVFCNESFNWMSLRHVMSTLACRISSVAYARLSNESGTRLASDRERYLYDNTYCIEN